ncbi:MAG: NADH-dependent [FeFe] hydrogenase, group A6 [Firmicutes bacterium]|nr:NADH-dependent [FeFe] hydrogenase, group A6 [Bacillota bacterium]
MMAVNLKINNIDITVPEGTTVLEAARSINIDIPTLCYLKDVNEIGSCRMCVVEIKGQRALQAACVYPVSEGMEVLTNTKTVRDTRKINLELILSNHERKCLTCIRNQDCELQKLSTDLGVLDIRFDGENSHYEVDMLSSSIVRNPNKCILCRRCISVCKNIQTVSVIDANERGFNTIIGSAFNMPLVDTPCTNCGQCIVVCPVGALHEKDDTDKIWELLADNKKHVLVQTAPAVRVALGEEFGMPIGTRVTGKMVTALKLMGFDGVFDTDTAADFTIMEEGTEFLNRLKSGKNLPLITSCSPGWVKFCEHNFPDFLDNLSTAKSPHQMFGAIMKSYYAEKKGIDPADIAVISVMPCTAKKFESKREELAATGHPDVDAVITTRELGRMIKQAGIDFTKVEDSEFDAPFGEASGAGVIFGATGGVMEAALRTVADILTGEDLQHIDYTAVRGLDGIKEATVEIAGTKVHVAVASGLGNARKLLEKVRSGEQQYHFIEIMGCPGGCITGGGQPIVDAKTMMDIDVKAARAAAIYAEDKSMTYRKSHENPIVKKLYKEYFGKPCGHLSHNLLHTHYVKRENY